MNTLARLGPTGTVRREQLSDEVAARLRAEIMTGALRPDTFIRLDETAARLGVSITPVREALRTLRGEGMVEPHRGHRVVPLTRTDIEDIFWLQSTIAAELAATATERITDHDIDELARLNDRLAAAVQRRDPDEIARAELAFHWTFNQSSGRVKLAWFLLHTARYLPPQVFATDQAWGAGGVAGHTKLIDALRRRDANSVVMLTKSHFTDAASRLIAWLDQAGLWD
ncbi:MAG: GntR family transcriptional regulator [Mycobacterium sp.]